MLRTEGQGPEAWLGGFGRLLVAEIELVEVGGSAVRRRGRRCVSSHSSLMNTSRLSATSAGESIGRMNSQTRARSGLSPPGSASRELARHPLRAERLGACDAGGVEHERGAQPCGELGDAAERVGVVERALELGVDDRVGVSGLVAAGVADGLLALGVGPAGAVGDQLAGSGGRAGGRRSA